MVELHQAFFWVCEECGGDNFARAVTASPEMVSEAKQEEARRQCEPFDEVEWVMKPDHVVCKSCGEEYEVESD